ncbi:MAG: DMT family transporter [Gammaproteobacteria bacterium]
MKINKLSSLSLLLLLGFIWGTGYSIARFAMTNGVPPLGYSFWQSLGPAILIGLLAFKSKPNLQQLSVSHLRYYLICGLTGIVIPNTNMYFAAPHLPAGLLAVIVNTVPIIAYPLALFARVESFSWTRFFGVIFALCGLMLIILPKTSLPSVTMIPWALAVLLTPLSFAFCSVYIARFRPANSNSITIAAGTLIFSSLLLLPLVLFNHSFYLLHFPLTTPDKVIVLEIILSSLGYIIFFQLIKIAGPVYYSLVDTVVSLTGLMWGYMIFHEKLNQWTGAAVLLILCALLLVTKRQADIQKKLSTLPAEA